MDESIAEEMTTVFGSQGTRQVPKSDVRLLSEIMRNADRDHLTGLKKGRVFESDIKKDLLHLEKTPIVVVGVDLNELKLRNEVFGYAEGDDLVVAAAQSLQRHIPHTDTVYRPHEGGDEFFIILRDMKKEQAEERMKGLVDKLNGDVSKDRFAPTMSMAFICLDKDTPSPERTSKHIVHGLSEALHVAKRETKKAEGVVTYSPDIVGLIKKLRGEGKDIDVFFGTQPFVLCRHDLQTGNTDIISTITTPYSKP